LVSLLCQPQESPRISANSEFWQDRVKDSVQASRSVISTRQLPSMRWAIGRVIRDRYTDRFWMRSNVACLSSGSIMGRAVTGMSDFVPCLTCRTISGCASMLAYQFRLPGELVINILSSIRCAQISILRGCLDLRPVVVISTGLGCPSASRSAWVSSLISVASPRICEPWLAEHDTPEALSHPPTPYEIPLSGCWVLCGGFCGEFQEKSGVWIQCRTSAKVG